jgi:hypothetical protein
MTEDLTSCNEAVHHGTLHAGTLEGGVVRARPQSRFLDHPGEVGIEDDEVGRSADGEAAGLEAEDLGGPAGHGAEDGQERDIAGMDEAHCGCEQGLEADGAVRGFGEGLPLDLGVLRIVCRVDDVDDPRSAAAATA